MTQPWRDIDARVAIFICAPFWEGFLAFACANVGNFMLAQAIGASMALKMAVLAPMPTAARGTYRHEGASRPYSGMLRRFMARAISSRMVRMSVE